MSTLRTLVIACPECHHENDITVAISRDDVVLTCANCGGPLGGLPNEATAAFPGSLQAAQRVRRYRNKAEECRAIAEVATTEEAKLTYARLARSYDAMADNLELASGRAGEKSA